MATLPQKTGGGIPTSDKGIAGGVATLDENGKIPLSQIPGGIGAGTVDSVNGVSPDGNGDVIITTSNIAEGSNWYYTQTRFTNSFTSAIVPTTQAIEALDTRVTSLETNKADVSSLNALDTRVTSVEGDITDLQNQIDNLVSDVDLRALETDLQQEITDRSNADSALDTRLSAVETNKADVSSVTALAGRVTTNESNIATLQDQVSALTEGVDLRALEADLQQEITDRTDADLLINTRLDDVYSHHLHSNSYYVNDGVNDFQAVLTEIGADQGNVIYASTGSYGGSTLSIEDKVNLGIICPDVGNTICELTGGRGLSITGTSERIRITNLQIEGAVTITGTKGRHIFEGVDFLGGLSINGTTDSTSTFMTFTDCEFSNQNITISNITNCTFYFVRCNFTNVRVIPTSVASPFLILLSECSGLNALQTNLTSGVAIVGRTGYSSGVVKVFSTSSNYISALGVETAFTGSYTELRDKPTLVTASTQLSDSSSLLRTSDKGIAGGVAELDSNGLIPNHHIPPLALTKPYVVNTIADRDALTGINTGDVAIVVDDPTPANNGNYIYDSDTPGWIALYNSTSPISSVNGQVGAVTLYTGDITEGVGAQSEPSNLWFTDARALEASVTSDIDDSSKAPSAPTVKTYVEGLTDALDTRVTSLENASSTYATTNYVDTGLNGKVNTSDYTANDVLTKIKTVDGSGSGLDADLLDGLNSSDFVQMTGAQTIAGVKTFSDSPIVPDLSAGDNSTKAANSKYVDNAITNIEATIGATGNLVYKGTYNASTSLPSLALAKKGFFYQVSASGTLAGVSLTANDQIVFTSDVSGGVVQATDFIVIDNTESGLSNGGLVVATASNGARMSAGVYYLHDSSSNISLTVPPQGSAVGLVCYLRIRGTGSVTLNAEGVSGGTFIVYADSGTLNGVKSVVLSKAGEYKLVCTRRTTSGTVYSQWDVTVSNDRALRSTSDLVEGTNLYYTDARARSAFSAGTGISLTSGTIASTITQYTDENAVDAVGAALVAGSHTGISFTYGTTQDTANRIDATVSVTGANVTTPVVTLDAPGTNQTLTAGNYYITASNLQGSAYTLTPPSSTTNGEYFFIQISGGNTVNIGAMAYYYNGVYSGTGQTFTMNTNDVYCFTKFRFGGGSYYYISIQPSINLRTTTNINEGTNLYFTDERAQDASASLLTTGTHTGISYSYNDASNKIDSTVSLSGFSIDALSDVDTSTTAPTDGQALAWSSSGSKWIPTTISGGGSTYARIGITEKTSSFAISDPVSASIVEEHYKMNSTSATTFTLPTAVGNNGLTYDVTNANTGIVTVATVSSQTISGLSTVTLDSQWQSVTVRSDGSNWIIK